MDWNYDQVQIRTRDLLREAEQRRLAREAIFGRPRVGLLTRGSAALGRQLIQLGARLSPTSIPTQEPACVTCGAA